MAKTPVLMKIQDYKDREVQMVTYEFDQETDREGQMTGIPRGGKIQVRVKALNDGTPELMAWMCDRFLKKDGSIQFLVSDTGEGIPEEKREDVFKPFLEIRDLTTGDGLGLPTCKQMALKMNGDLDIDPNFTKGTRFVLDLHS